jgi:hypothetical protein
MVTNSVTSITSEFSNADRQPVVTSPGTDVTTYHNDIAAPGGTPQSRIGADQREFDDIRIAPQPRRGRGG